MESGASVWSNVLMSWGPILVMVGAFVFFVRKAGALRQGSYMERNLAFMERQELLLERIATALEQRNGRG